MISADADDGRARSGSLVSVLWLDVARVRKCGINTLRQPLGLEVKKKSHAQFFPYETRKKKKTVQETWKRKKTCLQDKVK